MSEHPSEETAPEHSGSSAAGSSAAGSSAARGAWMASGLTFFVVGVVFTITMPDNIALGITFLGLGVVFFSLAGSASGPGTGSESAPSSTDESEAPPR